MKARPVDQVVYEYMFPKPKSTDPQNFQVLLQRSLVPEVRLETQAFYGHLSSQEAKYPGLDYAYAPHRVRLSRFQWHRRLFRAFDHLQLTDGEIANLTKWEGTRWAKERFEREQGIVIRDTTGDGIEPWVEPELRVQTVAQAHRAEVEDMEDIQEDGESENEDLDEDEGEDSDVEIQSVGIELNERLRAAAAQREAGNVGTIMDEEWEQWLKEAAEAGGLPFSDLTLSPNANIEGTRPAGSGSSRSMDSRMLNAARLGQWQQIPDFLHNIVRQNIEAHNRRMEDAAITSPSSAASTASRNAAAFRSAPSPTPRVRMVPAAPTSHTTPAWDSSPSSHRLNPHIPDQFSRDQRRSMPLSMPGHLMSGTVTRGTFSPRRIGGRLSMGTSRSNPQS
ncbi:hypothetical protein HYFRA_00010916 [Hymenoscyphus fraxineus]|uniref:Uncharacterized protein n=1 Tax=Hymenoscyphus fraxineus TaxID=746836 RepID=A0A9N9L129_9HELO|nr:hypothetical protein HYFRA_00010916 [Hymenoscyphus fraxineus]